MFFYLTELIFFLGLFSQMSISVPIPVPTGAPPPGIPEQSSSKKHLLSMRVMRLTRPGLAIPPTFGLELGHDSLADVIADRIRRDPERDSDLEMENIGVGSMLMLPLTLGNTYFGETFSCYLHVQNVSGEVIRDIVIAPHVAQCDTGAPLPSPAARTGSEMSEKKCALLDPGQSIDHVVHHEMVEEGKHVLACIIGYTGENGERVSFKKSYQFLVQKPLDLKTKFHYSSVDEVFLEVQVKNLAEHSLHMEDIRLEPTAPHQVEKLEVPGLDDALLTPQAVFQYVFRIWKSPPVALTMNTVGKLHLVWRGPMGERGRLQTKQLGKPVFSSPSSTIHVNVLDLPSCVPLQTQFPVVLGIENASSETLSAARLIFNDSERPGVVIIHGKSVVTLPQILPGQQHKVSLTAELRLPGFQTISGLSVAHTDASGQLSVLSLDEIADMQVYVTTGTNELQAISVALEENSGLISSTVS